jgi:hypothetical protein
MPLKEADQRINKCRVETLTAASAAQRRYDLNLGKLCKIERRPRTRVTDRANPKTPRLLMVALDDGA